MNSRFLWTAVILGAFAGAGCGSGNFTDVEGVVTLNDKPLADVQVQFLPDPQQQTIGPHSTGITDAQGRFKLIREDQRPGAVIGKHKVLIQDLKQWEGIGPGREDANKPLKPSRVPARYTDALATPFQSIEVKAGGAPIKLAVTTP